MRALFLIAALWAAGCNESRAPRTIGAVCMRAKNIADAAHVERVEVSIALKAGGGDRHQLASRCRVSLARDEAVRELYPIILDAQLATVEAWTPLSNAIQKLAPRAEACEAIERDDPGAFSQVRAWAESMQLAHKAAYDACRSLAK